jgi:phage major head subunit gpT-like protein
LEYLGPNTESAVWHDRFVYGVRARYNVGYGDPRLAVRITN